MSGKWMLIKRKMNNEREGLRELSNNQEDVFQFNDDSIQTCAIKQWELTSDRILKEINSLNHQQSSSCIQLRVTQLNIL